jgi:ribose/xylose/arabinose/galactoside ABC-type transport system permease subunit
LLRLPFYIVTPAAWGLTLGLSLLLSSGPITQLPGRPVEWSLPLLVVLNLVVYGLGVVALFLLGRFTSLGKLTSLNARSEREGRPGGLALALYKIGAYTMSGLLAAVTGLASLNFLGGVAQSGGYGDMVIAAAIAATVVGGVPLWKGATRLLGAFLGTVALMLIVQAILAAQMQGATGYLPPSLAWAALAVPVAILWGVAGWVLDLVFGRRKGTQVGDAAQHVTGGDR